MSTRKVSREHTNRFTMTPAIEWLETIHYRFAYPSVLHKRRMVELIDDVEYGDDWEDHDRPSMRVEYPKIGAA